ncbi:S-adenosylmethionine uptake transporter [Vogesella indigofera]|uniref:S-adenosylmethionine uptake transporter n=1 Tax=Vogesella indigofera TaxID=45465 RepID=A0A495B9T2_VOGIN|nr:DMT family transporter [Vogesella indigofera]RKQ57233.1 S-adenosylmethionine uptake transporter [Vogesella indigofera]
MSRLGSGWMVVAALCFALMSLFAAQGSSTLPAFEVLFYRTFIGLLVLLPLMWRRGESLRSPHWGAHARRSLIGYLSMAMLFYALSRLPLAAAVTLNYTSSLSFALCCVLLRRERLPPAVWFALSLGFVGIACMLRPTFDAGQWFAGLMGLGSGLGAGLALFHVRELGELGERPSVTVFWLFFLSSLFGLLVVLFNGGFHVLNGMQLAQMLAVGLMGLAGQLAMTRAYKEGRKFVVSSLAYLTVAFSALMGLFLHQQQLPLLSWLGMTLIIGSGILAARR